MRRGELVVCVNCEELKGGKDKVYNITEGNIYEIKDSGTSSITVINDLGSIGFYDWLRFESLEKYRMNKINKVLE